MREFSHRWRWWQLVVVEKVNKKEFLKILKLIENRDLGRQQG
jgi:hypothetical protein